MSRSRTLAAFASGALALSASLFDGFSCASRAEAVEPSLRAAARSSCWNDGSAALIDALFVGDERPWIEANAPALSILPCSATSSGDTSIRDGGLATPRLTAPRFAPRLLSARHDADASHALDGGRDAVVRQERNGRGLFGSRRHGGDELLAVQNDGLVADGMMATDDLWGDLTGPFRAIEARVETNDSSSLLLGGGTIALWEGDSSLVATRLLGGYRESHDNQSNSLHGTVDLFGATALDGGSCPNYLVKGGVFVDAENHSGKWGPEFGLLLGAQSVLPVTFDLAYGSGYGETMQLSTRFLTSADSDLQMRLGVLLSPGLQVGGSYQYLRWSDGVVNESTSGGGGFVNVGLPVGSLLVDVMATDQGTNGLASLVFTTGGPGRGSIVRAIRGGARDARITLVQNGSGGGTIAQGWSSTGVLRSTAVRTQDEHEPFVMPPEEPD